ncbi:hypothetical protein [Actinoplanes sp. L3-i22]|uniref:hypothetical protein n=1 Tax=Actinoplanes sp. L3-i22 TaxID=2836373 RepID=UPI001C76C783|nr:hypothetical protein [Actinoplanes sp. L3-i22]BCY06253.1 hypothetical protein L3i22_013410 [Actinoplanes sp. L3-i22]
MTHGLVPAASAAGTTPARALPPSTPSPIPASPTPAPAIPAPASALPPSAPSASAPSASAAPASAAPASALSPGAVPPGAAAPATGVASLTGIAAATDIASRAGTSPVAGVASVAAVSPLAGVTSPSAASSARGVVASGTVVASGGVVYAPGAVARIVGVSLGHATLAEADHWIHELNPAPVLACTHLVQNPYPHVAISLLTSESFDTDPSLRAAADSAANGPAGRAVIFPGSTRLTGSLTVSEILQRSSIARVEILGSGPAAPTAIVATGDFVRPQFRSGELILVTTPAAGDLLVPFEHRDPTPCCAGH